jgi:hypothetical protein
MRIIIAVLVILEATKVGAAPPTRDAVGKMQPVEAVAILDQGPANWFSWCAIVDNASPSILSSQSVRDALIRLLEKIATSRDESMTDVAAGKPFKPWTGECRDECSECLSHLEKAVADTHDSRALGSLVKAGSTYAAEFGDAAIPAAQARYRSVPHARAEMVQLMGFSVDRSTKPESKAIAEAVVFEASASTDSTVRRTAVRNLRRFDKAKALKRLKEIAQSDLDSYVHKGKNKRMFPIRDEAQKEFDRLSNQSDQ